MTTRGPMTIPSLSRRAKVLIAVAVILLALLLIGPRFVDVYTNFLWYDSVGRGGVLWKITLTRIALFLIIGAIVGGFLFFGMWLAYRVRPAFLPAGPNDPVVRYRAVVTSRIKTFALVPTLIMALLVGLIAQTNTSVVLLFLNRTTFGVQDPQFHFDIGFYAFILPFIQMVLNFLFVSLIAMFFANMFTHYIFGGIKLAGRDGALSRGARIQLASIAGCFLLLKAVAYWFDRYQLLFSDRSPQFNGAGYTDVNAVMPSKLILMAIAVICAGAFFGGIVMRDLRVPAVATVLMLFSSLVVGFAWPQLLQTFSVKSNVQTKEVEYVQRNIEATKQAYGLDNVTVINNFGASNPTDAAQLDPADAATITNARLLDPNLMSQAFQNQNQLKQFYGMPKQLTLDRYTVNGKLENFLVAPVELASTPPGAQDWTNQHLVYTHGDGLLATLADGGDGATLANHGNANPKYYSNDLAAISKPGYLESSPFGVKQPRIYYGELIAAMKPDYAIVGGSGPAREYDQDGTFYTFNGQGGVQIGNVFNRLAYAIKFGERNLLLSSAIGKGSKILYDRDPRDRVQKVAPWLTTDSKTYPIVDKKTGHILWVVDGYTTLPNYPYAQRTSLQSATADATNLDTTTPSAVGTRTQPDRQVSYIRNSVKATVDAYDGSVKLYQQDTTDPVLKAWMKVFPGVVQPKSDMPADLVSHIRYPEDLFKVQRDLLTKYHVDQPVPFLQSNGLWSVPDSPRDDNTGTVAAAQPPYYSVAADPTKDDNSASFQLTSVMLVSGQQYLSAQISASSSPDNYGHLTIRQMSLAPQLPGPEQAVGLINAASLVTADQANIKAIQPEYGNMLSLPLKNGGLVYVRPMYSVTGADHTPKLFRVMVLNTNSGNVGYAATLQEAMEQAGYKGVSELLGGSPDGSSPGTTPVAPPTTVPGQTPPGNTPGTTPGSTPGVTPPTSSSSGNSPQVQAAIAAVQSSWQDVLTAQKTGDQGKIGAAMAELQKAINALDSLPK